MSKPNGILAMNPEKYREIDGVVFDEASYARHCQPKTEEAPAPETAPEASEPAQSAAPAPVFAVDPYPEGWYPADDERPPGAHHGRALSPRQRVRKPLSPHPVKLPLYRPFACRAAQAPARI